MSVLIDSSCWVEALRKDGNPAIVEQVKHLLLSGTAATCPMIMLELWNGARGEYEKTQLKKLGETLIKLEIDDEVWSGARELSVLCRTNGLTIPSTDLLIISVSRRHSVSLIHADRHFDLVLQAIG